jgi:hypothetical protein
MYQRRWHRSGDAKRSHAASGDLVALSPSADVEAKERLMAGAFFRAVEERVARTLREEAHLTPGTAPLGVAASEGEDGLDACLTLLVNPEVE